MNGGRGLYYVYKNYNIRVPVELRKMMEEMKEIDKLARGNKKDAGRTSQE